MRRYWLVFSQAVTVLLAAWFVVATLKPEWIHRGDVVATRNVARRRAASGSPRNAHRPRWSASTP
jgi:serine protease DegQ